MFHLIETKRPSLVKIKDEKGRILCYIKIAFKYNCSFKECEENYFGFGCKEMCNGTCNGCNKVTGVCDKGCKPGWKGIYCHESK